MTLRSILALALLAGVTVAEEVVLEECRPAPGALVRVYALPAGRSAIDAPSARTAAVGDHQLILVDVDGNDAFDDEGVDGWTVKGQRFLFPFGGRITLGATEFELEIDGQTLRFEGRPVATGKNAALLAACNRARMREGVLPITSDPARARGCADHAAYMDRWGITRRPSPERAGYTEQGARAASQGLLMRAAAPERVVSTVFRSFPNRIWLFHPLLDRLGVAATDGHVVLDISAPLTGRRLSWPVLLPAPGSTGNATTLIEAGPKLFDGKARGLPITLQFPGPNVADVKAEVRVGGAGGTPVEIAVGTPASPAHPSITGNAGCVCVVPISPLEQGRRYFVRVRYSLAGEADERSWWFETGGRANRDPGGAAEPARDLPERARLKPVRIKQAPLLRFRADDHTDLATPPRALGGQLGKHRILLFDLNGNGSFGDLDSDGWTLKGLRYAFPLEDRVVLGETEFEIAVGDGELLYKATKLPARRNQRKAVAEWNTVRMRNGLPPVSLRPEYSVACGRHAEYVDRNGMTRRQEPGKPGYSEEGAQAGRRSALAPVKDLSEAFRIWEQRFANRHLVFSPHAGLCGLATGVRSAVFDVHAKPRRRQWRWPVLVPAPESEGCPVSYIASDPPLFPGEFRTPEASERAGFPITLQFPAGRSDVKQVRAELRERGESGPKVDLLVAWPDKPAHERALRNLDAILLLPKKHLRKRTRYHVRVQYVLDGKPEDIRWWFRTGKGG